MEYWTSQFWEENEAFCLDELKKDDAWCQIPLINSTHANDLKEGHLVRFCGMIQDMYDPVYYLASYEVHDSVANKTMIRSGKFKDSLQCYEHEKILFESDKTVNQERLPVYCISVPAVNQWAECKKCAPRNCENESTSKTSGVKRTVEDDVEVTANSSMDTSDESNKRMCSYNPAVGTESVSLLTVSSLPTPTSHAEACIVNFYNINEGQLKINDVVEVAGFLSYDPATVTSSLDGMEDELPPPSLVPRLHAVSFRPVSTSNPLITPQVKLDDMMANALRLREDLKLVLTQLLLGDTLAADYMICHLLSRIYLRQDMLVLGKFSLNLSNMPHSVPDYPTRLYKFLQNLLVKSHFLPMTLTNMNTVNMIPKKNYESNRLESGMLQLSDRTHLVIDETQLEPGQLNEKGVHNCRALNSIITYQRLGYDFQFYPVEFNTDIPVLVLSEGKSILPSDCHLPVEVDSACLSTLDEVFTAATHYLKEPLLSQLRIYLSLISTADYDLSPSVQELVQEDFVKMRRENPKFTAQDLHSLLVLAKLLSLSRGSQCLTKECWESAQQMELQRKRRLLNSNR